MITTEKLDLNDLVALVGLLLAASGIGLVWMPGALIFSGLVLLFLGLGYVPGRGGR